MRSHFRSFVRTIAAVVIGLMVLTQTSCVTVQLAPSLKPGEGGTDPSDSPSGGSGGSSVGSVVGIATVALVGGYLLYKGITNDPPEEEGESTLDISRPAFHGAGRSLPDLPIPSGRPEVPEGHVGHRLNSKFPYSVMGPWPSSLRGPALPDTLLGQGLRLHGAQPRAGGER